MDWNSLFISACDNDSITMDIKSKVIKIDVYHSQDTKIIEKYPLLKKKGFIPIFYDLTISTEQGILKLLLNPHKNSVQRGEILQGSIIYLKSLKKITCEKDTFLYFMPKTLSID